MTKDPQNRVTLILDRIRAGDVAAKDDLLTLVYEELRGLASALYHPQKPRATLQPTVLVHEAWLKMVGHFDSLDSRRHFFAVAARAMRQVMADAARDARRQKRGGVHRTISLDEGMTADVQPQSGTTELDLIALDESLAKLANNNEQYARIVELRLIGTLTMQEIADELGIAKRTAQEHWAFARSWLRRELSDRR